MKTIEFTAGRLLCSHVRNFLKKCQFKGMSITFMESDGWIERDFVISGNDDDMVFVKDSLNKWVNSLD